MRCAPKGHGETDIPAALFPRSPHQRARGIRIQSTDRTNRYTRKATDLIAGLSGQSDAILAEFLYKFLYNRRYESNRLWLLTQADVVILSCRE